MEDLHPHRSQQRYIRDAKSKLQYQQAEHPESQLALRRAREATQQQPANEEPGNHRGHRVKKAQALAANCCCAEKSCAKAALSEVAGKSVSLSAARVPVTPTTRMATSPVIAERQLREAHRAPSEGLTAR